jgi:hypothetical protein
MRKLKQTTQIILSLFPHKIKLNKKCLKKPSGQPELHLVCIVIQHGN